MSRVNGPEVVDEQVEDAEDHDQETGAPTCLEADNDHDAGTQSKHRDDDTCQGPLALDDETDEKEDEQHSTGQLEVNLAVGFAETWKAGKDVLLGRKTVGENHHETAYDGQVAEEEVEIENETVSETLNHDDTEQCTDRDLGVLAHDHSSRGGTHDLSAEEESQNGQAKQTCQHHQNWITDLVPDRKGQLLAPVLWQRSFVSVSEDLQERYQGGKCD